MKNVKNFPLVDIELKQLHTYSPGDGFCQWDFTKGLNKAFLGLVWTSCFHRTELNSIWRGVWHGQSTVAI